MCSSILYPETLLRTAKKKSFSKEKLLTPKSQTREGGVGQINRDAVYVNKDGATGFWGNDLAICAKASSTLVDTTPVDSTR